MLARWVAAEVVAQRVDGMAWIAWLLGALGLVAMGPTPGQGPEPERGDGPHDGVPR